MHERKKLEIIQFSCEIIVLSASTIRYKHAFEENFTSYGLLQFPELLILLAIKEIMFVR